MNALPLSRRSLVKRGVVGGALLSLGTLTWLGLRSTRLGPEPRRRLRVLNRQEYAVAGAIAAALFPVGEAGKAAWPTPWELECPEKFDDLLAKLHPEVVTELRQLLALFENGLSGLFTGGRPVPFTRLEPEGQRARLEAWRRSKVTLMCSGYLALTRLFHAIYYATPEVHAHLGYPGPPIVPREEPSGPGDEEAR